MLSSIETCQLVSIERQHCCEESGHRPPPALKESIVAPQSSVRREVGLLRSQPIFPMLRGCAARYS